MDHAAAQTAEHLRIALLLERQGDAVGAILAYRVVIRCGDDASAAVARRRVEGLARLAGAVPPGN